MKKDLLQQALAVLESYDAEENEDGAKVMKDLRAAIAQPVPAEEDAKDAKRLDWLEAQLFTHRWNSVIGVGHKVNWSVVPHYRHNQHALIGQTFREALDAAIASKKAKP